MIYRTDFQRVMLLSHLFTMKLLCRLAFDLAFSYLQSQKESCAAAPHIARLYIFCYKITKHKKVFAHRWQNGSKSRFLVYKRNVCFCLHFVLNSFIERQNGKYFHTQQTYSPVLRAYSWQNRNANAYME